MADLGRWSSNVTTPDPTISFAAPNGLFGTQDRNDGSVYSMADSIATLTLPSSDLADGYKIIVKIHYVDTTNSRSSITGRILQTGGTGDFLNLQSGGYSRNNANNEHYLLCEAFVNNPSASATFQFTWRSNSDVPAGGPVKSVFEVIPMFYSNIGMYSDGSLTLYGGITPNVITLGTTIVESDTAAIERVANVITVKGDNLDYFITGSQWSTQRGEPGSTRTQRIHGFDYDGTQDRAVQGKSEHRLGGADATGSVISDIIRTVTANRTIEMTLYRGDGVASGDGGADVDAGTPTEALYGLVVLELNSTAEVFRTHDATGAQALNAVTALDINAVRTTDFIDSGSWLKVGTVGMENNSGAVFDALCGANVWAASTNVASGIRGQVQIDLTVDGVEDVFLFHGNYIRGNQSGEDTFGIAGNPVGFVSLADNADIGVSATDTGQGHDIDTNANTVGMWGINLDTLEVAGAIHEDSADFDFSLSQSNTGEAVFESGVTLGISLSKTNTATASIYEENITLGLLLSETNVGEVDFQPAITLGLSLNEIHVGEGIFETVITFSVSLSEINIGQVDFESSIIAGLSLNQSHTALASIYEESIILGISLSQTNIVQVDFEPAITLGLSLDYIAVDELAAATHEESVDYDMSLGFSASAEVVAENSITFGLGIGTGGGAPTVIDNYAISNNDSVINLSNSSFEAVGQSFTGDGSPADEVDFELNKTGSPTGNAVAKLRLHSGTFGFDGIPIGPTLATSDNFDVSTLTGTPTTITFNFSTPFTPVNGTNYFVTVEYSGGGGGDFINVGYDGISPTHGGNYADFFPSSWFAIDAFDFGFELRTAGGGVGWTAEVIHEPAITAGLSLSETNVGEVDFEPFITVGLSFDYSLVDQIDFEPTIQFDIQFNYTAVDELESGVFEESVDYDMSISMSALGELVHEPAIIFGLSFNKLNAGEVVHEPSITLGLSFDYTAGGEVTKEAAVAFGLSFDQIHTGEVDFELSITSGLSINQTHTASTSIYEESVTFGLQFNQSNIGEIGFELDVILGLQFNYSLIENFPEITFGHQFGYNALEDLGEINEFITLSLQLDQFHSALGSTYEENITLGISLNKFHIEQVDFEPAITFGLSFNKALVVQIDFESAITIGFQFNYTALDELAAATHEEAIILGLSFNQTTDGEAVFESVINFGLSFDKNSGAGASIFDTVIIFDIDLSQLTLVENIIDVFSTFNFSFNKIVQVVTIKEVVAGFNLELSQVVIDVVDFEPRANFEFSLGKIIGTQLIAENSTAFNFVLDYNTASGLVLEDVVVYGLIFNIDNIEDLGGKAGDLDLTDGGDRLTIKDCPSDELTLTSIP